MTSPSRRGGDPEGASSPPRDAPRPSTRRPRAGRPRPPLPGADAGRPGFGRGPRARPDSPAPPGPVSPRPTPPDGGPPGPGRRPAGRGRGAGPVDSGRNVPWRGRRGWPGSDILGTFTGRGDGSARRRRAGSRSSGAVIVGRGPPPGQDGAPRPGLARRRDDGLPRRGRIGGPTEPRKRSWVSASATPRRPRTTGPRRRIEGQATRSSSPPLRQSSGLRSLIPASRRRRRGGPFRPTPPPWRDVGDGFGLDVGRPFPALRGTLAGVGADGGRWGRESLLPARGPAA